MAFPQLQRFFFGWCDSLQAVSKSKRIFKKIRCIAEEFTDILIVGRLYSSDLLDTFQIFGKINGLSKFVLNQAHDFSQYKTTYVSTFKGFS